MLREFMAIYPTLISVDNISLIDIRGLGSIEISRTGQNYSVTFKCDGRTKTFTADPRFLDVDSSQYRNCRSLIRDGVQAGLLRI